MVLTEEILTKSGINKEWLNILIDNFEEYNICASENEEENVNELSMFLAQCGHESLNFTKLVENLNYSSEMLIKIFKSKVEAAAKNISIEEKAKEIVSKGEKYIGNFIYGGREDLGNVKDKNDGWNFRGRGIIQITGRNNYKYYGEKLNINLIENPDLAADKNTACKIACCYWILRGIQPLAKKGDVKAVTRKINGKRCIGLEDRTKRFDNIKNIILKERKK